MRLIISEPFEGTRYSIVAFTHNSIHRLNEEHVEQLVQSGFASHRIDLSVGSIPRPPPKIAPRHIGSKGLSPAASNASKQQAVVTDCDYESDDASPVTQRAHEHTTIGHLLELCFHENSTLGELSVKHGLYHTRVTGSQDFTTDIGLTHAVDKVTSAQSAALLWVSMPCTGGFSLAENQLVNRLRLY